MKKVLLKKIVKNDKMVVVKECKKTISLRSKEEVKIPY